MRGLRHKRGEIVGAGVSRFGPGPGFGDLRAEGLTGFRGGADGWLRELDFGVVVGIQNPETRDLKSGEALGRLPGLRELRGAEFGAEEWALELGTEGWRSGEGSERDGCGGGFGSLKVIDSGALGPWARPGLV